MKDKIRKNTLCARLCTLLLIIMLMGLSACGKKTVQVFLYEETDTGTIKITGLTEKGKNDSTITVPAQMNGKPVTEIAAEAFRDNHNLTAIKISEGILRISENAFLNCTQLSEITFPQSLQEVGTNMVKNTAWEKELLEKQSEIIVGTILVEVSPLLEGAYQVPDGVTGIASGVFYRNERLTDISLPDSLEVIAAYAFAGCTSLQKIELPLSVWSIGYGAFEESGISELTLSENVRTIGANAFRGIEHIYYYGNADGSPWGAEQRN